MKTARRYCGVLIALTVLTMSGDRIAYGRNPGISAMAAGTLSAETDSARMRFAGPTELVGPPQDSENVHAPRPNPVLQSGFHRFWSSPTGALFKSVVVPGGGQLSNGKWQKALAVAVVEGYFLGKAIHWRGKTWDRLNAFNRTKDAGDFNEYLNARDARNRFYWFLGTAVFVSMWDAYADAHLLVVERTRDEGAEFWGGESACAPSNEMWMIKYCYRF